MGDELDDAVATFAEQVGTAGPITVAGSSSRGGPVVDVRCVSAPARIEWIQPAEMTMRCGAGTAMDDIDAALAEYGQCVAIPASGTVGGALAVGHSGIRRLDWGPVRDTLLQLRYVSAAGEVVKGGGPTVKNVSGFDLCRLFVGSRGTLGFIADVILRTRPLPVSERWFTSERDPWMLLGELFRPSSVLWNGRTTWVLLDGHPDDVAALASASDLVDAGGPPVLPPQRWSLPPASLTSLREDEPGTFVAEIGVGIVHHTRPPVVSAADPVVVQLNQRVKDEFDPSGRLNPGVAVLQHP